MGANALQVRPSKRVFGYAEAVFDVMYLVAATVIGVYLLMTASSPARSLAGAMALLLAGGDLFHLLPRIALILTGKEKQLQKALGFGKLVTSLTMTIFYLMLWHLGLMLLAPPISLGWTILVYALAVIRIALCLPKENGWYSSPQPVRWAVYRNVPFLLLGLLVAALFGMYRHAIPTVWNIFPAVLLSFAFYLPVAFGAGRHRMLGMLMLPKTCMYLWILWMCLSI